VQRGSRERTRELHDLRVFADSPRGGDIRGDSELLGERVLLSLHLGSYDPHGVEGSDEDRPHPLSAKTVVHGHEQTLKFTTTLSPAFAGVRTGTVTVVAGKVKLCSVNITAASHGKGTCSPTATALTPGSYSLTAIYGGASNFASSASGPVALKVT
jgi:hypothetical protein